MNITASIDAIEVAIQTIQTPAGVIAIGQLMFGSLSTISLSWLGVRIMLEGGVITSIAGNFLRTLLFIGLCWWFMPGGGDVLVGGVVSLTDQVASAFLGGQQMSGLIVNGVDQLLQIYGHIGDAILKLILPQDANMLSFVPKLIANLVTNGLPVVCLIFALGAAMVAIIIYALMFVVSLGLTTVAVLVAPILIPCLVLPALSFIFDGWLRFLLVANFYKVVAAILMLVMSKILTAAVSMVANGANANLGVIDLTILALYAAGFVVGAGYLLLQTGMIAQALFGGSAGFSISRLANEGPRPSARQSAAPKPDPKP